MHGAVSSKIILKSYLSIQHNYEYLGKKGKGRRDTTFYDLGQGYTMQMLRL